MLVKKNTLDRYIKKLLTRTEVSKILGMHPNAVSRLKDYYLKHEDSVLVGRKTGPKKGFRPHNRISEQLEDLIVKEGGKHPEWGPVPLADHIEDIHGVSVNQATIWRVLARAGIRYTTHYKRWKAEPKPYCLDTPGKVLQMDACYPFGRSRDIASFDAIDDCSRFVYGRAYDCENDQNAMDFVTRLIKAVPFTIQAIRVDNRYGKAFKQYCEEVLGIKVIYNDPYCPQQNGKIERYHKTLKQEFYFRHIAFTDNFDTINYKLALWQHYYNTKRKHTGYGMNSLKKLVQATYQSLANSIINQQPKVTLH